MHALSGRLEGGQLHGQSVRQPRAHQRARRWPADAMSRPAAEDEKSYKDDMDEVSYPRCRVIPSSLRHARV